ncbi:hypothetical protein RFI_20021 [Reticulomyxa filosa]|uniref:FHA domain-containing protein n=1 Tax=Reticulomyxa filosa TaxID=46433 RepID=X6MV21_RETFI|nr:hypothetical protein RFI_20021 [Reticulomyxa filosa]|eukprot:ETO17307.1 hypothetical protein RFI_20021 [Reticulomyxa filosa]
MKQSPFLVRGKETQSVKTESHEIHAPDPCQDLGLDHDLGHIIDLEKTDTKQEAKKKPKLAKFGQTKKFYPLFKKNLSKKKKKKTGSTQNDAKIKNENKEDDKNEKEEEKKKLKADFKPSGALLKDKRTQKVLNNVRNGVKLEYTEVSEGCLPTRKWRWYVFKGNDEIETLHLHRQSHYLIGRDERVCDIVCRHPSASKQHCVLQYRMVDEHVPKKKLTDKQSIEGDFEDIVRKAQKPYLMDLNSRHGTFINGMKLDGMRFYELLNKDVIKIGLSSRTYIMMSEDSAKSQKKKTDNQNDDNPQQTEQANDKYLICEDIKQLFFCRLLLFFITFSATIQNLKFNLCQKSYLIKKARTTNTKHLINNKQNKYFVDFICSSKNKRTYGNTFVNIFKLEI